jgi:hypothetical protein
MNPIAGAGKPCTYIPTEETEQPQDNQNNDDGPQHEISPSLDQMKAAWSLGQAAVDDVNQSG